MQVHVFLRDLLGDCGMRWMLLGPIVNLVVDRNFTRDIAILGKDGSEGCEEKRDGEQQ